MTASKRCLLVLDAPDGGVAEHVLRVALGLRERDWEPWIAGPASASIYPALRTAGIPVTPLPFRPGYGHPLDDGRALAGLIGLIRRNRFDLVNAHSPKSGVLARAVALAAGVPTVFTAHGLAFNPEVRGQPGRAVSFCAQRLVGPRTGAIICVSEAVRRLALERRLAPPGSLHTIHNGAAGYDTAPEPDPELERFSREGPLAGCVTVLGPGKGVDVFLRAAPAVLERLPESRLAVVGNGVLRHQLEQDAGTLGLDRRLRFFDYAPPSARQLRSLDVFVLPSRWEAFPIAPLEAMACGVPQVATDAGGTPEAVRDGETGLLCRPNDPSALADRIVALLGDPGLRARMSEASRERHRRLFTLDRMLDETTAVFDRVAEGGRRTALSRPRRYQLDTR